MMTGLAACWLMMALSGGDTPVPPEAKNLLATLRDPDMETRHYAAMAIAQLGPPVVDPLIATLRDKDRFARAGAAYALSQMGIEAKPARSALDELLKDPERTVRRQASYAILKLTIAEREAAVVTPDPNVPGPKP